ncbi:MAG: sulfite exporter TauE/SafE family protein [bacterium]|nr:sulfite exporter TauE/SafE family protein [bacterium]
MVTKALLLGLSTGPFCLAFCLPVLFPLTCARGGAALARRARVLGEFSLGRLVAYLTFGGLVGLLGQKLDHPLVGRVSAAGLTALAVLLIAYGLVTSFPKSGLCHALGGRLPERRLPLAMGFLTGLNACPPFLLAVAYVFTLGRVGDGLLFFLIYFVITSLWLLPMVFLGGAARYERVRWLAQLSSLLAGLLFLWLGLTMLAGGGA